MSYRREKKQFKRVLDRLNEEANAAIEVNKKPIGERAKFVEEHGILPVILSRKSKMSPEDFLIHLRLAELQDSFVCQSCGNCCREEYPVVLAAPELELLANALGINIEDVKEKYVEPHEVTPYGQSYAIKRANGACIFLEDNRCKIHAGRPMVCRNFPFYSVTSLKLTSDKTIGYPKECLAAKEFLEKGVAEAKRMFGPR